MLKTKNMPLLATFLAAHVAAHLLALGLLSASGAAAALEHWQVGAATSALAMVAAFIVSDVLNDVIKAQLVFWRLAHPLPGSFAFSRHVHDDHRIDLAIIARKHAPLPLDPADQNRVWYNAVFKPHRNKPSVAQSNGRYLLLREMTAMSVVLAITLGPSAIAFSTLPPMWIGAYVALLVVQYPIVALAAANAGVRLVKNALAEDSN